MWKRIHHQRKTYPILWDKRKHTGEQLFICNELGKGFAQRYGLTKHKFDIQVDCELLVTNAERDWSQHKTFWHTAIYIQEKNHLFITNLEECLLRKNLLAYRITPSGEKPFVCIECERRFTQKQNMIAHNWIHSGQKPFLCNTCEERFARQEALVRHSCIHKENSHLFKHYIFKYQFARRKSVFVISFGKRFKEKGSSMRQGPYTQENSYFFTHLSSINLPVSRISYLEEKCICDFKLQKQSQQ